MNDYFLSFKLTEIKKKNPYSGRARVWWTRCGCPGLQDMVACGAAGGVRGQSLCRAIAFLRVSLTD